MAQYLPIVVLTVLAVVFAGVSLVMSRILAPRRPTIEKFAPYECGIIPGREPPQRFPVRFYLIAMLFVIFDVELIFLYPWAMVYRELAFAGLIAMLVFSLLVFESFVYLIAKGALEWGPLQVNLRPSVMRSPTRTSTTTIRRVGLEGRYEEVAEVVGAAPDVAEVVGAVPGAGEAA